MVNELTDEKKNHKIGMLCALGSMVLWGFAPIYWRMLIPIDSHVIILYRIVLAGIICGILALKIYGIEGLKAPIKNKGVAAQLFVAGILITINWSTYVYAVNSGQTIEAGIGYYINPLVVCVFGVIFFKERLTKYKTIAVIFALTGVIIMLIHFMRLPVIPLTLAISFAIYAAVKKRLKVNSIISLFYETVILAVISLVLIVYFETTGQGALYQGETSQFVLLLFSGIVTAVPLMLFTMAANRISLISLGIFQYIAPSITLLIGIFVFREAFDFIQLIACIVIWTGLVFFTYGEVSGASKKYNPCP